MSQYLLSVWHDDEYTVDFSSDEAQRTVARVSAFNDELTAAEAMVFGGGLIGASSATVLRLDAGDVTVADGPYAGTQPQMGGFWVIEAPDPEAAMTWARKATIACGGPCELRPFQEE